MTEHKLKIEKPLVIITRPQPGANILAQKLADYGLISITAPLLEIKPTLLAPPDDFTQAKGVIITSAASIRQLENYAFDIVAILLDMPCLCIGDSTAKLARDFGFKHVACPAAETIGNGASLAQLIITHDAAMNNTNKRFWLHLVGAEASPALSDCLSDSCVELKKWVLYSSIAIDKVPLEVISILRNKKTCAVTLMSMRTAAIWEKLIRANNLVDSCSNLTACVLSNAIAYKTSSLPWQEIRTAENTRLDSLIKILLR